MFNQSFAFLVLFFLMPVLLIVGVIIKLDSRGPVLHWSKRIGKDNVIFYMPKLRTMKVDTPQLASHLILKPENFVTRFGHYLRKFSIDEFPQFWSVLQGKMNIVGPRPALFNQTELVKLRKENYLDKMKPGITGWAQINGRDLNSIEEKVELEKYYLKKQSFLFDIYIIILTILRIFSFSELSH